jgi:hypothetical protein
MRRGGVREYSRPHLSQVASDEAELSAGALKSRPVRRRDHVRRGAGAVAAIVLLTVGALDEVGAVKVTWPEVLTVAVSLDGTVLFRAGSSLVLVPDSASAATPTASTAQTVWNRARCLIGEFIAGFTLASWVPRLRTRCRRGRRLLAGNASRDLTPG